MLIKLQKTRFSSEYFIIEGARHMTYRAEPLLYFSEDTLRSAMSEFMNGDASIGSPKKSCWYQIDGDAAGFVVQFDDGYAINEVSFENSEGTYEVIRFDGDAFICNDEGKTIQKVKKGGCASVFRPVPTLTGHIPA